MLARVEHNLSRWNPWWIFLLFVALTMGIYATSFENQFLVGDEETIILRNVFVTDWKYLPKFFTENYKAGSGENSNYYRPIQMILTSLLVQTTGYEPWPFHLISLLFHAGCGFFFYRLMREYFATGTSALLLLLGGFLWIVHPAHNEEMAVATGVASSTHLFFMLIGVFYFFRYLGTQRARHMAFAMMANVAALLSKESAIVFPGLILGCHLILRNLENSPKVTARQWLKWHLPFWVISLGYVTLRLTVLNFDNTLNFYKTQNAFTESFLVRLYTFATVILQQIKIFFIPIGLHPEREWPVFTNPASPQVIAGFLAITLLLGAFVYFWKKAPLVSLGIGWFLGSYIPMSNLFARINAIIWDHWLYTPSVGIVIVLLYLFTKAPKIFAYLAFAIPTAVLATTTFVRNPIWEDSESWSRFILEHEPQSAKTMTNLAIALGEKGKTQESIAMYKKAIALNDVWPQAHHNLAVQYVRDGQFEEAKMELQKAISMQADFFYSMNLLGGILLEQGRKEEAAEWYRRSLQVYPHQEQIQKLLERATQR